MNRLHIFTYAVCTFAVLLTWKDLGFRLAATMLAAYYLLFLHELYRTPRTSDLERRGVLICLCRVRKGWWE